MKQIKRTYLLFLLIILLGFGCQDSNKEMSIRYSEKKYQLISTYNKETGKYDFMYSPVPDKVIPIEVKVLSTQRPLVDSMSISQEKTKTIFEIQQGYVIPKKPQIKKVKLIHFTYIVNPPMVKNDLIELIFDSEGNFIDVNGWPLQDKK